MSEIDGPVQGTASNRTKMLRAAIYACVAVQVLIYLYLFVYIGEHTNPKGDGMEWVAIVPGGAFSQLERCRHGCCVNGKDGCRLR